VEPVSIGLWSYMSGKQQVPRGPSAFGISRLFDKRE